MFIICIVIAIPTEEEEAIPFTNNYGNNIHITSPVPPSKGEFELLHNL
jgi:hypothetical protein